MLRVTYEIIPFGIEDHFNRRVIGVQEIGLLKNTEGIGHYVSTIKDDSRMPPKVEKVFVDNDRSTGAWELVRKTLEKHCGLS